MRLAALLLLAALPAYAEPGFFRDPGDRGLEPNALKASSTCLATVEYNSLTPTGIVLSGLTVACYSTSYQALIAAATSPTKLFILGEPAHDPNYECVAQVSWDPSLPSAVAIIGTTTDTSCPHFRSTALFAAAQLVRH